MAAASGSGSFYEDTHPNPNNNPNTNHRNKRKRVFSSYNDYNNIKNCEFESAEHLRKIFRAVAPPIPPLEYKPPSQQFQHFEHFEQQLIQQQPQQQPPVTPTASGSSSASATSTPTSTISETPGLLLFPEYITDPNPTTPVHCMYPRCTQYISAGESYYFCKEHAGKCCVKNCGELADTSVGCLWDKPRHILSSRELYRRCLWPQRPLCLEMCSCRIMPLCTFHQRTELAAVLYGKLQFPEVSHLSPIGIIMTSLMNKFILSMWDIIDDICQKGPPAPYSATTTNNSPPNGFI
jgi:hypothetical protein